MADYYPLIARAVEGLERNTGENRRVLYERARGALVSQLRSSTPPLDEAEITRVRLALEDAIRRIESDAARRREMPEQSEPPPLPLAPSLSDQALQGFRDNVAEAEGLGDASAQASQSARAAYEARHSPTPVPEPPPEQPDQPAAEPFSPEEAAAAPLPETDEPPPEGEMPQRWPPTPPGHYEDAEPEPDYRPKRSYRGLITTLVVLLLVGGLGAAAYWQRQAISSAANKTFAFFSSMRSSTPPTTARPAAPAGQPKINDRVGGSSDRPAGSATAPAADVAQKVVLYEEEPNNPQGKRYVGSAIWRTETVSPGPGLAPELAIRADIEIPERRLRMTWSLRRNTDKALPASHTIEIMFTLAADFSEGGVQNVPGVLMKQNEGTRGVPLAGLAVKVTNGFFLIGLSAVDVDMQRNIALLKERPWFDIPVVYNTNKRAIVAVEKGTPGERAFEEAFRAWGQ
jgi:hypothetical protein